MSDLTPSQRRWVQKQSYMALSATCPEVDAAFLKANEDLAASLGSLHDERRVNVIMDNLLDKVKDQTSALRDHALDVGYERLELENKVAELEEENTKLQRELDELKQERSDS